jgi:hypothetical protein
VLVILTLVGGNVNKASSISLYTISKSAVFRPKLTECLPT